MKPICFLDIESTGTDPAKDRIITLTVIKLEGDFIGGDFLETGQISTIVNPGIPIPPEATEVHGITDEMVKACDLFSVHAQTIHDAIKGCHLAGYNSTNFDIPLLWEELNRAGIQLDLSGVLLLDACVIFKKMEERTLKAAMKFYCGREHEEAHDATADVRATIDVFRGQMARYENLRSCRLPELAEFCKMDNRLDLAGKIVRDEEGHPIYAIGKAKGVRVQDDPGFGRWMIKQDFSENTKQVLRGILG